MLEPFWAGGGNIGLSTPPTEPAPVSLALDVSIGYSLSSYGFDGKYDGMGKGMGFYLNANTVTATLDMDFPELDLCLKYNTERILGAEVPAPPGIKIPTCFEFAW